MKEVQRTKFVTSFVNKHLRLKAKANWVPNTQSQAQGQIPITQCEAPSLQGQAQDQTLNVQGQAQGQVLNKFQDQAQGQLSLNVRGQSQYEALNLQGHAQGQALNKSKTCVSRYRPMKNE